MANKESTLGNKLTLREYLNERIGDESGKNLSVKFQATDNQTTPIYCVNLLWDGDEYYIAYTLTPEKAKADTLTKLSNIHTIYLPE